ncbi:LysM peptidoglycan-binding domain-containing protein [Pontibaca salina]|uniref:LysM peptidoglycan-binding domain-containing protein n=1 Tax=Pontibaca salina TaxID=2795731 RepID=A0A934HRF8_9RHOB|nr:LysM peptidoglycan-binding domain-containing protein [Pontibaca salina]MBI6629205.1 LysM peptidoglycan-binding domain-containing protein [Pontibaca salina]
MGQKTAGGRRVAIVIGALAAFGVAVIVYLTIFSDQAERVPQPLAVERQRDASNPPMEAARAPDNTGQDAAQFDVVRVDPDGTTVIAGTAPPGAQVTIMVDETEKQSVKADSAGQFAALLSLPHSDAARVLTLDTIQDGQSVLSQEQIILAPSPAAKVVTDEDVQLGTGKADAGNVTVLRADADGIEVIQPSTPEIAGIPDTIALDAITYDDDGRVRLGGRAKAGSRVRVYLDNAFSMDLSTDAEGRWQTAIEGIDPGLYTLRLDEISRTGEVISRIETPFQRESPEALMPADPETLADPVRAVTVQRGDTLWAISRDRLGEGVLYLRVFEANRDAIRDPDLIYPGQVFAIPH